MQRGRKKYRFYQSQYRQEITIVSERDGNYERLDSKTLSLKP